MQPNRAVIVLAVLIMVSMRADRLRTVKSSLPLPQKLFHLGLRVVDRVLILGLDGDAADKSNAHDTALGRRQGNDDDIVLVLPVGGLALFRQDAYYLERRRIDADGLAQGVPVGEQVFHDGPADDAVPRGARHIAVVDIAAFGDAVIPDVQDVRRRTQDLGIPVLVALHDLVRRLDHGRHVLDAVDGFLDGLGVLVGQARAGAGLDAGARRRPPAGHDDQQVAAQAGNVLLDLLAHTKAQADHGNDGADADNDAQKGQQGTQLVADHAVNGHLDRLIEHNPLPTFRHCSGGRRA